MPYIPTVQYAPDQAEYGIARLAGRHIPIVDPSSEGSLARFQPKVTFGDYTRDSDDLISVWVQSDWRGGGQAFTVNAASQNSRWWDSTLDTERSNMLTLRERVYTHTAPVGATGDFYPLVDYGDNFYGVWGTNLCTYDDVTHTWALTLDGGATPITLDGAPVEHGVVFDDKLYIPLGTSGLNVFDGTALTMTLAQDAVPANINAISLELWDDKLIVLTPLGEYRTFDDTTWSTVTRPLTLHDGSTPRKLVTFLDQSADPTVYIVTSRGLWAVDPVNAKLVRPGAYYPPHPTQGLAAAVWRVTDLFISVGIGVHQWNTDVFSPMGLDRDDGLPARLRGAIVDFFPEYNGLLGLVEGESAGGGVDDLVIDEGQNLDDLPVFPSQRTVGMLQRWNQFGWHKVWESQSASGSPTFCSLAQSESGSRYDFFWGYGTTCYRQPWRIGFYNPQQGVLAGLDHFEPRGTLRTGRWNGNMPSWPKLASHMDINLMEGHSGSVTIEYMTDRTNGIWTPLGQINEPTPLTNTKATRFYFGGDFIDEDLSVYYGISTGIQFDWIEFQYTFEGIDGNDMTTPIVDSFIFKFIKLPLQTKSWTFEVPIDFDEQFYGIGPGELMTFLTDLPTRNEFIPLVYKDQTYRVLAAQTGASKFSGENPHGRVQLIVLEVD